MELLGFSIAGIIAAAVSWVPLFLIDAFTYLVSAASLLGVVDTVRAGAVRGRMRLLADIRDGAAFVWQRPTLRAIMSLSFFVAVPVAMTYPVLVILSYRVLGANAAGYGFLEAAIGGGAILGSIVAPAAIARYRVGRLILLGVAGTGLSTLLTGLSHNFWLALVCLFGGGLFNMLYYVPLISLAQREGSDNILGRIMGTRFLLVQAGFLLGMAVAGPLTDHFGASWLFVGAGAIALAAALVSLSSRGLREASLRDNTPAVPVLRATAAG